MNFDVRGGFFAFETFRGKGGEGLEFSEGVHLLDKAVGGDAGALFIAAVSEFSRGMKREVAGAGVVSGEEDGVLVFGEGSFFGIEEELVDGVWPGVGDKDGGA